MKTNIKLRVTPEQSEAIQKICFANNTSEEKELKLDFLVAPYLFISNWEVSYTHNTLFYNKQKEEEVDADLFIRTNGTCIESTEALADECNFAKYGFEKPNFECELFGTVSDSFRKNSFVIGVVKKGIFNNCPHMWSVKNGTCYTSSLSSNMPEYNLTPIKKPWYETCKFPVIVKDEDGVLFTLYTIDNFTIDMLDTFRPLTNDEIDQLKQDF